MTEPLTTLTPDRTRAAKTQARCHAALAARRRRIEARLKKPNARVAAAERLLAAGVCVAYLVAMAGTLLTLALEK